MNINTLIRKIYLPLPLPTETDSRSDCRRILDTLAEQGFDSVQIPLAVRQQLYPLLPQSGYRGNCLALLRRNLLAADWPGSW